MSDNTVNDEVHRNYNNMSWEEVFDRRDRHSHGQKISFDEVLIGHD